MKHFVKKIKTTCVPFSNFEMVFEYFYDRYYTFHTCVQVYVSVLLRKVKMFKCLFAGFSHFSF